MTSAEHPAPPDLERRFGGLNRLYGNDALRKLSEAHVCVVGIGGVGSWAVEALARSGVGRLTLIDMDHVAESNINRQIHALDDTLGKAKIEAMAQRLTGINPNLQLTLIDDFLTPENCTALIPPANAVIDAIDNVRAKIALAAHCARSRIQLVIAGGAGGKSDPSRIRIDDLSLTTQDPLLSKVRAGLRRNHGFPRSPKKIGIPAVYSTEPIRYPATQCPTDSAPQGLACAGYGSSVAITASFGFFAAGCVLEGLTKKQRLVTQQ